MSSSYNELWTRTQRALHYLWERHGNGTFDFILKADDDTFVAYDAFVNFLSQFDAKENLYIGHPLSNDKVSVNGVIPG